MRNARHHKALRETGALLGLSGTPACANRRFQLQIGRRSKLKAGKRSPCGNAKRATPQSSPRNWRASWLKRHSGVRKSALPTSDRKALKAESWKTLTVWECETRDTTKLSAKLARFLA